MTLDSNQSICYARKDYRPVSGKGHNTSYHPTKEWMGDPMDVDAQ